MPAIPVVDIFAGAGGLGEGFAAFGQGRSSGAFELMASAEMDAHAAQTLRTRAFFRQFRPAEVPESYYHYAAGQIPQPWTVATQAQWKAACHEVMQLRLGDPEHDEMLRRRIRSVSTEARRRGTPWVLVGGPPCQAFSLIGRARNRGKMGYVPEDDERHYLYQHYLTILAKFRPAVFVLENVKGMLSSKLAGESVFSAMFEGLQQPGGPRGPRYRIEPIVQSLGEGSNWQPRDFIVHAEALGLPQARHRVILVGVLEGAARRISALQPQNNRYTVADMISGLPRLRSNLTDTSFTSWPKFSHKMLRNCARYSRSLHKPTAERLRQLSDEALEGDDIGPGERWIEGQTNCQMPPHLDQFIRDPRLNGVINHQTRGHMASDLMRYGFAAAFTAVNGRSPRGCDEFPSQLHPMHRSWFENNRFVDRFKVQRNDAPSSTVTSHIAKDGHYYIHPDALQLRSLTVREAARLQTFPDNYIFEGPAVSQRRQVGNAVPPWLGYQIASVVHEALA